MSQELMHSETAVVHRPQTSDTIIDVISRAASDPNCDTGKMQALINMQVQVMGLEAKKKYDDAMSRVQESLPTIQKEKKGANGKYASIENIDAAISPILKENGFHFTFTSTPGNGKMIVTGKLRHRDGHQEESSIELAIDKSGSKNDTQGGGSTIAYGRRYLKLMMLDLTVVGDDRDGATSRRITKDQALNIDTLIQDIPDVEGYRLRVKSKLLASLAADTVEDILADRYSEAINKLARAAEVKK